MASHEEQRDQYNRGTKAPPLLQNALHGREMTPFRSNTKRATCWIVGLGVLLLMLDQVLKFWVKLNMSLGESIEVTSWFKILFIENEGMAFGIKLGSKLFLTLFRIVAMAFLCWGLIALIRKGTYKIGFLLALTLIFVGGVGNIIDSLFYGLLFSESVPFGPVAEFLPDGGGYAPLFYGKVVDMFYFPLIDTVLPSWMPFVGGERFTFFDPIFNLADSYISVGVVLLILFYWRSLSHALEQFSTHIEKRKNRAKE